MAEIFISYKSERRKAAEHLATILHCHGYTVWFDYQLVKGYDFARQIDRQLRDAKAVVVLWCTKSVASDWVIAEASLAQKLRTLVPVMIEPCEPLVNFQTVDYVNLSKWDGAPRSTALDGLIDALEERIGRPVSIDHRALRDYDAKWRLFGAPPLKNFALEAPLETVQPREGGGGPANPGENGVSLLALAAQEWPAVRDSGDVGRLLRFEQHFAGTYYYASEARALREEREAEKLRAQIGTANALGELGYVPVPSRKDGKAVSPWLKPGETFKDIDNGPEMAVIPAGKFLMGSKDGEGGDDERPQHLVTIARPFAVGKYPVTFDEWDACRAANGTSHNPGDQAWGRGRRPVINVSWNDAKAYAAWLSKETGQPYRLLSEAEWEYCCRAGTTTAYSTGKCITKTQAQFDADKTVEVGSFPSNAFGLHDMHGNVWEWCEDLLNGSYKGAPTDGSAWTTGECSHRVLRGGSWNDGPRYARAAYRFRFSADFRYVDTGFRLARTLNP